MRKGFTLLEMVFVIVIFGILSKFGAELLFKIYENYIYSNTFNRLQNQSEAAVKQIANRLQYRIRDSVISRNGTGGAAEPIGNSDATDEDVLEWVGIDIDGWKGINNTNPNWSGFIDIQAVRDSGSSTVLFSPGTQYNSTSGTGGGATTGAIFFVGSDVDLTGNFGWGGAITDQTADMHPIKFNVAGNIESDILADPNFSGVRISEFYQFSTTAYAVHLDGTDLKLYYGYQPWDGDNINTLANRSESLIMEGVTSFKFYARGDIMIIQVCIGDNNVTGLGEYSACKEKVVF